LDSLRSVLNVVEVSGLGLSIFSLQALLLGLTLSHSLLVSLVGLLAGDDISLASGRAQVRNSDVDSLGEDSAVDFLVDDDTDGSLVHVEHNTGAAVVVLERHTFVDGRVNLDVNIVTSLEVSQPGGGVGSTLGLVSLLEQGSSSTSVTKTVWHFL
jgi:hypothetical protein